MRKIFLSVAFLSLIFFSCESKSSGNNDEIINDKDSSEVSDQEPDIEYNDINHESDLLTDSESDVAFDDSDHNDEKIDDKADEADEDTDEETDNDSDTYYKAPENLSADDGISHNRVLVTWDELPNSPKVYIYRSDSESGPFENLDNTWTTGNEFSDENIVPGQKYYYKAKADYSLKRSDFSNMDSGYSFIDETEYVFNKTSGEEGDATGQFQNPTGINYIDYNLVIADTDNNRVQFLDPENLSYISQTSLGFSVVYPGLAYPAPSGNPILLTTGFDGGSSFMDSIYYMDFNFDPGETDIKMLYGFTSSFIIWNIYGEEMSLIHVVDKENSKIHVLNLSNYSNSECLNDYCLNYVRSFGSEGSEEGKLKTPSGAAIFDNIDYWSITNIYVVDSGNNRINVYQMYNGGFVFSFGSLGSNDGEFNNPTDITISEDGYIFVTDSSNNRIQKFSLGGSFITKFGESGSGDGQFNNPTGITVDNDGNVFVVDQGNNRIQKFKQVSQ